VLEEPVTVAFRVDRKIAEAAERTAVKRGLTISEWLRELVADAIREPKRPTRSRRKTA
jgi:antitoxin component of RelBE/YafQ-DinJ toxin-antitoxin module